MADKLTLLPSPQRASWYNADRVSQKGSVILQKWVRQHGPSTTRARQASKRAYAGAQIGRTVSDWIANSTSADAELFTSLRTLRNRARQMVRDNEYAKHVIERVIPNNVIGTGVRFEAQVK